jgi:hypothetical protein
MEGLARSSFRHLLVEEMNSNLSSYAIPLLILLLVGIYYFNGTQTIINPTAQQSLDNLAFVKFFVYSAIIVGVIIVSMQTRSPATFMGMIAGLSLLWFILGKSWQYVPG